MMRRLLRGCWSRGSKEKENEEKEMPKYNLPRPAEIRPCDVMHSWRRPEFMRISIIWLGMQESLTLSMISVISTSYSLILPCKIFTFMLGDHHPR